MGTHASLLTTNRRLDRDPQRAPFLQGRHATHRDGGHADLVAGRTAAELHLLDAKLFHLGRGFEAGGNLLLAEGHVEVGEVEPPLGEAEDGGAVDGADADALAAARGAAGAEHGEGVERGEDGGGGAVVTGGGGLFLASFVLGVGEEGEEGEWGEAEEGVERHFVLLLGGG